MEQVENMQDFNIPSIDHELTGGVENSVVVDEGFSSDESKVYLNLRLFSAEE